MNRSISMHTEKDRDVIEHLAQVPNVSKYIISLIRDDIQQKENIDDKIKRLINDALKNYGGIAKNQDEEKIINAIKGLF